MALCACVSVSVCVCTVCGQTLHLNPPGSSPCEENRHLLSRQRYTPVLSTTCLQGEKEKGRDRPYIKRSPGDRNLVSQYVAETVIGEGRTGGPGEM